VTARIVSVGWGRAQRNPSASSLLLMGFASLYPSYEASLNPRTTRVKRRRRRPVREHAADADLFGEHVQHRQRIAVAIDCRPDRFVIEAAALVQRAVALQRPADQVEAGGLRGLGVFGRDDFLVVVQRQHGPDRRAEDRYALRLQFRHRGFPGFGLAGIETLFLVALFEID